MRGAECITRFDSLKLNITIAFTVKVSFLPLHCLNVHLQSAGKIKEAADNNSVESTNL